MIQHHRPHLVRSALARVAITGTASIATIIAVAPVAIAAPGDDDAAPTGSSETAPPEDETPPAEESVESDPPAEAPPAEPVDETAPAEDTPPDEESAAEEAGTSKAEVAPAEELVEEVEEEVTPTYGLQKFRVGVQRADGAYAPDTSTVGSTIQITITGEVDMPEDVNLALPPSGTTTCTTDASTVESGSTASYCLGDGGVLARAAGGAVARSVSQTQESFPSTQAFTLLPGQTATITQLTAGDGLIKSPATSVIGPCPIDPEFPLPFCIVGDGPGDLQGGLDLKSTSVLFDNFGPPPIAVDDKITATAGDPTTIKVAKNDDTVNGAPVQSVSITSGPKNGTAKVSGSNVIYTADDEYDGTDTFTYRLTTANGSDTAEVTIIVEPDGILPDTGAPDNSLLGYGALMLAGGGWLVAQGRRRQDALVD